MAGLAIIIADIAEPSYNGRLLGNNPFQFANGVAGALMAIEWCGGNALCVEAIVEEVDNRVPISADEYFVLAERVGVANGVKLVVVHGLTVACPIDPVNRARYCWERVTQLPWRVAYSQRGRIP